MIVYNLIKRTKNSKITITSVKFSYKNYLENKILFFGVAEKIAYVIFWIPISFLVEEKCGQFEIPIISLSVFISWEFLKCRCDISDYRYKAWRKSSKTCMLAWRITDILILIWNFPKFDLSRPIFLIIRRNRALKMRCHFFNSKEWLNLHNDKLRLVWSLPRSSTVTNN